MEDPEAAFGTLTRVTNGSLLLSIVPLHSGSEHLVVTRPGHEYPLWMFSESRFEAMIRRDHTIAAVWEVPKEDVLASGARVKYRGYLLTRSRPEVASAPAQKAGHVSR